MTSIVFIQHSISAMEQSITDNEYLKIAATHSLMVFHAYDQYELKNPQERTSGKKLHFAKDMIKQGPCGLYTLTRHKVPTEITNGWRFFSICGQTGYNNKTQSLIGMVGYNENENTITVSFRGSQNPSDWEHNLNDQPKDAEYIQNGKGIKGHGGYLDIIDVIKTDLEKIITQLLSNNTKVILTGHSFGGGLASLIVPYIKNITQNHNPIIHLVTFGAPYVAKADYRDWLEENNIPVTTFMRQTDWIQLLPYTRPNCKNNVPLSNIIWLHHFYSLLWPAVHLMPDYQKGLLLISTEKNKYNYAKYVTVDVPMLNPTNIAKGLFPIATLAWGICTYVYNNHPCCNT